MKLSNVTISMLLGISGVFAFELTSLEFKITKQTLIERRSATFADIVSSQIPMEIAMSYMTINEIWKLANLDPNIHLLTNKTSPKVTEIAEAFNLPGLKNLKEHPDLALLEGYIFSDSTEDSLKKVDLLLDICDRSLLDSPMLAIIQEALIDEIITWHVREFRLVLREYYFIHKIEKLSGMFYGLEKYESVLKPHLIRVVKNAENWSDAKVSSFMDTANLIGFKNSPHGLKRWSKQYFNGTITSTEFASKLRLPNLSDEYIEAVIQALIGNEADEHSDKDLTKILELMVSIEQELISLGFLDNKPLLKANLNAIKLFCEFLLGTKTSDDVLSFLSQSENHDQTVLFFFAFLRTNQFEAAAKAVPERIFDYRSRNYVRRNAKFLKFLYETDREKLFKLAKELWFNNNTSNSLYVMMARKDPLAKALLQPDGFFVQDIIISEADKLSFDGICVEELLAIYNNSYINPATASSVFPALLYYTFVELANIKLRTPEGREWILSQFEAILFLKYELPSNNLLKIIYQTAQFDGSITKYFQPNCLQINCAAVIQDLEDSESFTQNKKALTDLFSLLKYFDAKIFEFPSAVFEDLNYDRLQRILQLSGVDLDQVAKFAYRTRNWFNNLQIIMMEMVNREGERAVFDKLNVSYPKDSKELNEKLFKNSDEFSPHVLCKQFRIELLPHMNDYRKIIALLTVVKYQKCLKRK